VIDRVYIGRIPNVATLAMEGLYVYHWFLLLLYL
jgi:hypothetical protein